MFPAFSCPAHPAEPPDGRAEKGWHVNGAGRSGAERARLRLSFRSEAFAQRPASLRGGGAGGGGGSGGIRKSTPCRVCTRAGKGPLGQTSQAAPGQVAHSDLRRGRADAAMNRDTPRPAPGRRFWAPTFQPLCCGPEGGTERGHLSCPSVSPLFSLSVSSSPWIPSPGVFLFQGLDARSHPHLPSFFPLLTLCPSTLVYPDAPRPTCPFLTRNARKPGFSSLFSPQAKSCSVG